MGFVSVLQIVFITLKLVGTIAWSWWLVLLPFEIGAVLLIGLVCLAVVAHVNKFG